MKHNVIGIYRAAVIYIVLVQEAYVAYSGTP
jgi:hypothetical protein